MIFLMIVTKTQLISSHPVCLCDLKGDFFSGVSDVNMTKKSTSFPFSGKYQGQAYRILK